MQPFCLLIIALAVALGTTSLEAATPQAELPNIIVILADDLGMGDLSCYHKDSKIKTPAIDAMARQGIMCSNAHSPSSVCTPTRYGLLTGRYCWRTRLKKGVLTGFSPPLIEENRTTIADLIFHI